jgi:hypothetical protein
MFPNLSKENFDKKYAVAKKDEKIELCLERIYTAESELKAKDDRIVELEKELATMHKVSVSLQRSRQTCLDRIEEQENTITELQFKLESKDTY